MPVSFSKTVFGCSKTHDQEKVFKKKTLKISMQFFKSNAHIEESNMQQTIVSLRQTSNAHIFHIGTFSLGRPHNIVQTQHFITGTVRLHITVQF